MKTIEEQEIKSPKAVNWHCEAYCNYGCKFCYAPFETQRDLPRLSLEEDEELIRQLADAGVEKINFVDGETMLQGDTPSKSLSATHLTVLELEVI